MVPSDASFLDAFKSNPGFMWAAILAGGLAIVIGLSALIAALRLARIGVVLGVVAVVVGIVPVGVGQAGMKSYLERAQAAFARPGVSATDRTRGLAHAEVVAGQSLKLGFGVGIVPIVLGLAAIVAAKGRK